MYDSRDALRFIRSHASFIIVGHKEPDGDCVASQLSVAAIVRALGKEATVHSAGPFDRPEISSFALDFSPTITDDRRAGAAVIIVDCSTPDRTGPLGARLAGLPSLVIDHHSSGEPFGDARFVDPSSPSTTMLVMQLFEEAGLVPDPVSARLLLFGLCTDTGFFRHLGAHGADTFRSVARLVEIGTSTAEVYMMVYGKRALSARKLLAEMLARAETYCNDRLILTWQTMADRDALSAFQRGEDELYRLLQTVNGTMIVALIKEESPGAFSVGLRSTPEVDVGAIAGSFGGGGHKQASGFDIRGSLESVKAALVKTLLPLVGGPCL